MALSCPKRRRGVTAVEYGILCFLIIVVAVGAVSISGVKLENVFWSIDGASKLALNPPDSKYCQSDAAQTNINYWYNWSFPSYACGNYGINGPSGPVYTQYSINGSAYQIATENSSGTLIPYALKLNGSEGIGAGTSATLFTDGYSYNAAIIKDLGISYSTFASVCRSGNIPLANTALGGFFHTFDNNTTYGPGTPYKTASGGYACGYTKIVAGSNQGGWPGL